jgi:hypothetical protein
MIDGPDDVWARAEMIMKVRSRSRWSGLACGVVRSSSPTSTSPPLTNATLPYALKLANSGWRSACIDDPALARGLNIVADRITQLGVAEALGMECSPPDRFLREPAQL